MRILTLSYEFPPIGGGGSGVVKGLSAEFVRTGHTVDVVTMGFQGLPEEETVDGISIHRVDCNRQSESKCTAREALRYVLKARPVVRRLLDKNQYDIVHTHFIFPDGIIAMKEAVPKGIPFIITAHGSDVPGYNPKLFFKFVHPFLKIFWRRVTRSAALLVSPSETLATLIESVGPDTPVLVIPNGISEEKFQPAEKVNQILVATRLVKRKGVQYLLKAIAGGAVEWPTKIIGSGEYQSELSELNDKLGKPAELLGWVSNESDEFRDLLQQSSVYVLPSDFENFPVSLLEAMAAGSAIVTTKGHGCEEVVGDAAELVTTGSQDEQKCVEEIRAALQRITTDAEYCASLGKRARTRLEDNFTWRAVAKTYQAAYEKYAIKPGR